METFFSVMSDAINLYNKQISLDLLHALSLSLCWIQSLLCALTDSTCSSVTSVQYSVLSLNDQYCMGREYLL